MKVNLLDYVMQQHTNTSTQNEKKSRLETIYVEEQFQQAEEVIKGPSYFEDYMKSRPVFLEAELRRRIGREPRQLAHGRLLTVPLEVAGVALPYRRYYDMESRVRPLPTDPRLTMLHGHMVDEVPSYEIQKEDGTLIPGQPLWREGEVCVVARDGGYVLHGYERGWWWWSLAVFSDKPIAEGWYTAKKQGDLYMLGTTVLAAVGVGWKVCPYADVVVADLKIPGASGSVVIPTIPTLLPDVFAVAIAPDARKNDSCQIYVPIMAVATVVSGHFRDRWFFRDDSNRESFRNPLPLQGTVGGQRQYAELVSQLAVVMPVFTAEPCRDLMPVVWHEGNQDQCMKTGVCAVPPYICDELKLCTRLLQKNGVHYYYYLPAVSFPAGASCTTSYVPDSRFGDADPLKLLSITVAAVWRGSILASALRQRTLRYLRVGAGFSPWPRTSVFSSTSRDSPVILRSVPPVWAADDACNVWGQIGSAISQAGVVVEDHWMIPCLPGVREDQEIARIARVATAFRCTSAVYTSEKTVCVIAARDETSPVGWGVLKISAASRVSIFIDQPSSTVLAALCAFARRHPKMVSCSGITVEQWIQRYQCVCERGPMLDWRCGKKD